ncbi:acetyltransferase [Sediminicola sp. YIK13]|uniref:GNAT family N-acetyltransferase n=1 Tax=Sediminicola sp. YIK13 TaxID=1453352 RepID=UPI0007216121|nr:GNAT family N-acetyltransferase [Sediminicola sp. YIK13]ALM09312.1 acetyltransferase [Sediminicola sp. YIK13]
MKYRKAEIKDLDNLSVLFDNYRVFYSKETDIESAQNFLKDRISKNDSEIFVAENTEHQLVGFVQLYPLFSSVRMKKLWLLNDLFVNYDYRKKGISLGLIDKAKELVEKSGACGMYLETEKSNLVGNNLYPKAGFELNNDSNFYEWYLK